MVLILGSITVKEYTYYSAHDCSGTVDLLRNSVSYVLTDFALILGSVILGVFLSIDIQRDEKKKQNGDTSDD